jgi:hypothetical protein
VAALGLAFSFWGLMYSRIGLRHISLPVFVLLTFLFFLAAFWPERFTLRWLNPTGRLAVAGLFAGLGFYTYFAARGVPLILLAWLIYLAVVDWPRLRANWRGLLALVGVMFLLALPLALTLQNQPVADARVQEVAVPIVRAQAGDFSVLLEHVVRTVNMFHSDGDDEWLYNIAYRPLFGLVGAGFFWVGVLLTAVFSLQPLWARLRRQTLPPATMQTGQASAFLMLWWLAGITPSVLSVPAGSLGHTIVAQSAIYLLTAVPLFALGQWLQPQPLRYQQAALAGWPPCSSSPTPAVICPTILSNGLTGATSASFIGQIWRTVGVMSMKIPP